MAEQTDLFGPDIPPEMDLQRAKQERDRGMAHAEAGSSESFQAAADAAIYRAAQRHERFIVDTVWTFMPASDTLERVGTLRAMGPAIARARKAGWIEPTSDYQPSAQVNCHGNPRRVWRSRIFIP